MPLSMKKLSKGIPEEGKRRNGMPLSVEKPSKGIPTHSFTIPSLLQKPVITAIPVLIVRKIKKYPLYMKFR